MERAWSRLAPCSVELCEDNNESVRGPSRTTRSTRSWSAWTATQASATAASHPYVASEVEGRLQGSPSAGIKKVASGGAFGCWTTR